MSAAFIVLYDIYIENGVGSVKSNENHLLARPLYFASIASGAARMQGTQGSGRRTDGEQGIEQGMQGTGASGTCEGMPETYPTRISASGAARPADAGKRKEPRYRDSISICGCVPRTLTRPLGA